MAFAVAMIILYAPVDRPKRRGRLLRSGPRKTMPQSQSTPLVAYSQFFWLLIVLAMIYFGIGRCMVPKIQSTVDARDKRIAEDLAAAQAARDRRPTRPRRPIARASTPAAPRR